MNDDMTNNDTQPTTSVERPIRQHRKPATRLLAVRNALNILFMLGAVVGVVCTLKFDHDTGFYIIGAAMVLKFVETAIRLLKL